MSKTEYKVLVAIIFICLLSLVYVKYNPWQWRQMEQQYVKYGPGKNGPIVAVLYKTNTWRLLRMDESDPVASLIECEDYVHHYGGGFCNVRPLSLGTGFKNLGAHTTLNRRWDDVHIDVYCRTCDR